MPQHDPVFLQRIVRDRIFYDNDDRTWKFWGLNLKALHGPFSTEIEAEAAADRYIEHIKTQWRHEDKLATGE